MLRTLIVGLGRAGWGLHLPVLSRARRSADADGCFAHAPMVVFDPRGLPHGGPPDELVAVGSLAEAAAAVSPAETVVHLCTPPSARADVLGELAELGFTKILVEKPLATDGADLARIVELRRIHNLELMVVAQWLDSTLTHRLLSVVRSGELNGLREVYVAQRKPRFSRSLAATGHLSAFDVEVPHSLGVALRVAGDAEVIDASWTDMRIDGLVIPRMGSAHMLLRHPGGVRTEIFSSLTSPRRERQITLGFEGGQVVGHYPESRDDSFAHLRVLSNGHTTETVLPDDSLLSFIVRAYRNFAAGDHPDDEFELNTRVSRLLCDAKRLSSAAPGASYRPEPAESGAVEHVS